MVKRYIGVKHIELECNSFEEISSYDLNELELGDFIILHEETNTYKYAVVQKGNNFITAVHTQNLMAKEVHFYCSNGVWSYSNETSLNSMEIIYMNENGFLLTPDTFAKTTTALVCYACKKDGDSPIVGGTLPLYNENIIKLFGEESDILCIQTSNASGGKTKVEVLTEGMSYYRIMIIKMPLALPNIPN